MSSDGEITQADIKKAYPHWDTEIGVDHLYHGRRNGGAGLTAKGESWQDLLDAIRRKEAWLWEPGKTLSKGLPQRDPATRYWQP